MTLFTISNSYTLFIFPTDLFPIIPTMHTTYLKLTVSQITLCSCISVAPSQPVQDLSTTVQGNLERKVNAEGELFGAD